MKIETVVSKSFKDFRDPRKDAKGPVANFWHLIAYNASGIDIIFTIILIFDISTVGEITSTKTYIKYNTERSRQNAITVNDQSGGMPFGPPPFDTSIDFIRNWLYVSFRNLKVAML